MSVFFGHCLISGMVALRTWEKVVGKSLRETETVISAVINYKESLESSSLSLTDQLTDVRAIAYENHSKTLF